MEVHYPFTVTRYDPFDKCQTWGAWVMWLAQAFWHLWLDEDARALDQDEGRLDMRAKRWKVVHSWLWRVYSLQLVGEDRRAGTPHRSASRWTTAWRSSLLLSFFPCHEAVSGECGCQGEEEVPIPCWGGGGFMIRFEALTVLPRNRHACLGCITRFEEVWAEILLLKYLVIR